MPSHLPPLHLILTGPGRIGAGLEPLLRADGHTVRILTRADYGDFADPAFDPHPTVDTLPADPAPDAILHLAGLFQIGPAADPDRLLRACLYSGSDVLLRGVARYRHGAQGRRI